MQGVSKNFSPPLYNYSNILQRVPGHSTLCWQNFEVFNQTKLQSWDEMKGIKWEIQRTKSSKPLHTALELSIGDELLVDKTNKKWIHHDRWCTHIPRLQVFAGEYEDRKNRCSDLMREGQWDKNDDSSCADYRSDMANWTNTDPNARFNRLCSQSM